MKRNKSKYVFLGLYLISIAVFYYFTLQSGTESTDQSSFVTDTIIKFLKLINKNWQFDYEATNHIVRKLVGHFGYSALIGFLGIFTTYSFFNGGKISLVIALVLGVIMAVLPELLQYLPQGRGPSFVDMMINFSGEETGIMVGLIINTLIIRVKEKR